MEPETKPARSSLTLGFHPPRRGRGTEIAEEAAMTRLRDYWLEMLATGVTVFLLAFVYGVLADYAAGPVVKLTHQAAVVHPAGRLAD
jgi:hypothetical protein